MLPVSEPNDSGIEEGWRYRESSKLLVQIDCDEVLNDDSKTH